MFLKKIFKEKSLLHIEKKEKNVSNIDKKVALAGNPNVGKSTVFNALTGLKQHTGNWAGKTVDNALGSYVYNGKSVNIFDLPGTYSLMSSSPEEEIARDFICFGGADVTVAVVDATCLERNLNLVLQIMEMTDNVILCVNLMDEAKRKKIKVDIDKIREILGIPVVSMSANRKRGLEDLRKCIDTAKPSSSKYLVTYNEIIENAVSLLVPELMKFAVTNPRFYAVKLLDGEKKITEAIFNYLGIDAENKEKLKFKLDEAKRYLVENNITPIVFRDETVEAMFKSASLICDSVVRIEEENFLNSTDRKIDKYVTSKKFGIPIMILFLGIIFYITIKGANYPSEFLSDMFSYFQVHIRNFLLWIKIPPWACNLLVDGVYMTISWVTSVMLPPMAIFFPLFAILEDLGYLPRIAFNLDNCFKKACVCGKQSLTMCMGFGCNAAGVVGCRIINSPREQLIAIITNSFVPCNGRFPLLITISSIFLGTFYFHGFGSFLSVAAVLCIIILGVVITLVISKLLTKTVLKGVPSSFTLELPPYRKPQIFKTILRSLIDKTFHVFIRAVTVAAPAGVVIWTLSNFYINDVNLLTYCAEFLQPFASLMGLDGYILMAFILALPANEIVLPILIMAYMSEGGMIEISDLNSLRELLVQNGWTVLTAINVMLFSLMHFPCATTLWTIKKETKSIRWTILSFLIPTVCGVLICMLTTLVFRR